MGRMGTYTRTEDARRTVESFTTIEVCWRAHTVWATWARIRERRNEGGFVWSQIVPGDISSFLSGGEFVILLLTVDQAVHL